MKKYMYLLALLMLFQLFPIPAAAVEETAGTEEAFTENLPNLLFVLDGFGLSEDQLILQKQYFETIAENTDLEKSRIGIICGPVVLSYTQDIQELLTCIEQWQPPFWADPAMEMPLWTDQYTEMEPAACIISASPWQTEQAQLVLDFTQETEDLQTTQQALILLEQMGLLIAPETEESYEEPVQEMMEEEVTAVPLEDIQMVTSQPEVLERYTVIILDTSGSLERDSLVTQKQAVLSLCQSLLGDENVHNEIALVRFDTTAVTLCTFTDDMDQLTSEIYSIQPGNLSNLYDGMAAAQNLFNSISGDQVEKNLIICGDGAFQQGVEQENGRYAAAQSPYYAYANAIYSMACELKKTATIYTIGTMLSVEENEVDFARTFMSDLSSNGLYYEASADYFLSLAFTQIGESILNGENSMVSARQPVQMTVSVANTVLSVGDTMPIQVSFVPAMAEQPLFSSTDEEVAAVSASGVITALKPGSCVIEIQSEAGCYAKVKLEVYARYDLRRLLGLV